jgi:TP901 family phage tail tape measure protein
LTDHIIGIESVVNINQSTTSTNKNSGLEAKDRLIFNKLAQAISELIASNKEKNSLLNQIAKSFGEQGYSNDKGFKEDFTGVFRRELETAFANLRSKGDTTSSVTGKDVVDATVRKSLSESLRVVSNRAQEKGVNIPSELISSLDKKIKSSDSVLPKETHNIINEMYSASKSMSSAAFKVLQTMEKMGELRHSGGSLDIKEFLAFGRLLKETIAELANLKSNFASIFTQARVLKETHGINTEGFLETAEGFKKSLFSKTGAMSRHMMSAPATVSIDMASMVSEAVKKAVPQLADSKQIKTIDKLIEKSAPYTEVISAVDKLINQLSSVKDVEKIDLSSLNTLVKELKSVISSDSSSKYEETKDTAKHTFLPKLSESYSKREKVLSKSLSNITNVVGDIEKKAAVGNQDQISTVSTSTAPPKPPKPPKNVSIPSSSSGGGRRRIICEVCGTEFTSKAPNAKYCSDVCRTEAASRRRQTSKPKSSDEIKSSIKSWAKDNKVISSTRKKSEDTKEAAKSWINDNKIKTDKLKSYIPSRSYTSKSSDDEIEKNINELMEAVSDIINYINNNNVRFKYSTMDEPRTLKGDKKISTISELRKVLTPLEDPLDVFEDDFEGFRKLIGSIGGMSERGNVAVDPGFVSKIKNIREILYSNYNDDVEKIFNDTIKSKKPISSVGDSYVKGSTYKASSARSYRKGKGEEYSYKETVISPSEESDFPQKKIESLPSAEIQRLIVEANADDLSKSLAELQKFMVKKVEKGLKASDSDWSIVRDAADQNISEYFSLVGGINKKRSGKQFSFKIADIAGLQASLGGKGKLKSEFNLDDSAMSNPKVLIEKYKENLFKTTMVRSGHRLPEIMAKWTKTMSKGAIEEVPDIDDLTKKRLLDIKTRFSKEEGTEPSPEFVSKMRGLDSEGLLEDLYRKTVNEIIANDYLTKGTEDGKQKPLVRELAIPAARMSESGSMVFDTQQGSQRVIPKFATYKTGFESMIEELLSVGKFDVAKHSVKKLGIRPKERDHELVRSISEQMLMDWATPKDVEKGPEVRSKIVDQYRKAAVIRAKKMEDLGQIPEKSSPEFISKVNKTLDSGLAEGFKSGNVGVETLISEMRTLGVDAVDLAKSMEKIEFKNIYDVIYQLLNIPGENKNVLDKLSNRPQYDANVRDFETLINKLIGTVPIADKSKPRRYSHQEKIINLMSLSTPTYGPGVGGTADDQKQFIRDLNLNLKDFMGNQKALKAYGMSDSNIPMDVTTISSLGVPETQASTLNEYRKLGKYDDIALSGLDSTSIKMYTDSLAELAPFGKQFQQLGRNIASTTGAKAYRPGDGIIGTETPSLRSSREHELIVSGRHGDQGYGFNVIAELRNTASTFEDQIVVSGKLADVLTQHVKTMVQPDKLGRVGFFNEYGQIKTPETGEVGDIKEDHRLVGLENANKVFQEVLGVKQEYRGRADEALIKDVEKAITVVRGKPLNVQIAKVVETFFNYYGRKFTTRYGSKGVSVLASGATEMTGEQLGSIIKDKKVEIIPEEDRSKAGLGTAIMPKSMGKLLSEVFENKGDTSLSKELIESGNKFILSMFTDANLGVVPEYEAEAQQILFNKVKDALSKMNIDIKKDVEGISQVKDLYSKQVPGGMPNVERPIDIRFSSYGIAKRGLQTENLEAIMNNVISSGGSGKTVLETEFKPDVYKSMLGVPTDKYDEKLNLNKISGALGFKKQEESIGKIQEEIFEMLKRKSGGVLDESEISKLKNKAKSLAELEHRSSFYSDIFDEFGTERKSLIGPKFVEITEDPHEYAEWSSTDIEKQIKGERLNLPAFGAYSAIFGESSKLLGEVAEDVPIESKKHWEYIKVLQTINSSRKDMAEKLLSSAKKVDVADLYGFTESTGHFEDDSEFKTDRYGNTVKVKDPRSFKDTVLDYEKYPGALSLQIPSTRDPKQRDSLYVPSSIGRTTYPEPTMAGEYGLDIISRRLNRVVVAAKDLDEATTGSPKTEEDKFKTIGLIKSKVSNLRSEARTITKDSGTGRYVENIGDMGELRLNEILDPMLKVLSNYKVNPAYDKTGVTRADYVMKFRQKKINEGKPISEVYQSTIDQAADQLLGQFTKPSEDAPEIFKERFKAPGALNIASDIGPAPVGEIAKVFGVDQKHSDKYIQDKIKALEKAKIEYYNSIATTVIGKTGSIQELAFTRKIPAVMAKAVTAVVDKTSEFEEFKNTINDILSEDSYGVGDEFNKLSDVSKEISKIGEGHAKAIEAHKKKGIPVLKQHELGVPDFYAEKLPVQFTKRYSVNKKEDRIDPLLKPTKVDSNLKEMLEYRESILPFVDKIKDSVEKQKMDIHLRKELTPYIESVRYPFTGISSVQPYEAKLLKPEKGGRHLAKHSLTAPGIPELDFDAFDANKKEIDSIIKSLTDKVDLEYKKEQPDEVKIDNLLNIISQLENALSGLIPKYIAQQQKLDFDGDQIEIHSAKTAEARREIEKHFKYTHSPDTAAGPTSKAFRDEFTYGAMVGSTGKYAMAEQQLAFSKKFPEEEGFGFMTKPFLTEQLEYLSDQERLNILAKTPDSSGEPKLPFNAIADVIPSVFRSPEDIDKVFNAISNVKPPTDSEGEIDVEKYSKDLLDELEGLGGNIAKAINNGIKEELFNTKYLSTINAQLFKINTGPDTEATNRLLKIHERSIGAGSGIINSEFGYNFSPEMAKRFPSDLNVTGKHMGEELNFMANELIRVAQQKGFDVKHAGEVPVAGEIAKLMSKGEPGAKKLISKIEEGKGSYKDIKEFAESNEKAIGMRLSKLSTGAILEDAKKIASGRGEMSKVEGKDREELKKYIVDSIGFKGYLIEWSNQIIDAAREALIEEAKSIKGITNDKDAEAYASTEIRKQLGTGGIDIGQTFEKIETPLYKYRTFTAKPAGQIRKYKEKFGDVDTSELLGVIDPKTKEADDPDRKLIYKYKFAKAISQNLYDDISNFSNSDKKRRDTYSKMVDSTIKNLKNDARVISGLNKMMEVEGDRISSPVVERLYGEAPMHSATEDVLKPENYKDIKRKVEKYARSVGAPSMTERTIRELDFEFDHEIGRRVEEEYPDPSRENYDTEEEYKREFEKNKKTKERERDKMKKRAMAIAQMDTIIRTAETKKGEMDFLLEFAPSSGAYKPDRPQIKDYISKDASDRILSSGHSLYSQGGSIPETPMGPNLPPSFDLKGMSDKPVPVYVVGVADGVSLNFASPDSFSRNAAFSDIGVTPSDVGVMPQGISKELMEKVKWAEELIGTDKSSIIGESDFGKKYRASGLKGGYAAKKVGDKFTPDKQVEEIVKTMVSDKEDMNHIGRSSSLLGTAIHKKLEDKYKSENVISKTGEKLNTFVEKPIPKFVDEIGGEFSGTMDVVREDGSGITDHIVDIKTVSDDNFSALFDAIKAFREKTGKETPSLQEIKEFINSKESNYLKNTKLDEVASQLNLYLAATNKGADSFAHFYSSTDPDKGPAVLSHKFDDKLLERDMRAVSSAREEVIRQGKTFGKTESHEQIISRPPEKDLPLDELNKAIDVLKEYYNLAQERRQTVGYKSSDYVSSEDAYINSEDVKNFRNRVESIRKDSEAMEDRFTYKPKSRPVIEGLGTIHIEKALTSLHQNASRYQRSQGVDIDSEGFKKFNERIQQEITKTLEEGPRGAEFASVMSEMKDSGDIDFNEFMNAWKAYRIAVGDYYVNLIKESFGEYESFKAEGDVAGQTKSFDKYSGLVKKFQDSVKGDLGKKTDIYTEDRMYIHPKLAEEAGVRLTTEELIKKASDPLEEDKTLKTIFNRMLDFEGEKAPIPRESIREALVDLIGIDKALIDVYTDAELVARAGEEIGKTWDFSKVSSGLSRLKDALREQLSYDIGDRYSSEQVAYLQNVLKTLKSLEKVWINVNTESEKYSNPTGEKIRPSIIPVSKDLSVEEQEALHLRNISNVERYFSTPESKGGASAGEKFVYDKKVFEPSGRVVENQKESFMKYGDVIRGTGEEVSSFTKRQKDLLKSMTDGNRTFSVAIDRVIKWGAAASLVYGGLDYIKDSIDQISDVEVAMAQLQMVMNPVNTDFGSLQKTSVGLAKQYGVPVTGVLEGMKVFAQQGLPQEDVTDRTKTAVLASNITTLKSTDATEALTAAMKVFTEEGKESIRFLDSWSNVESKAAITSGNLADAIKKSASAAKNAGFTFDQLNGIVTAIGSVTRQTGKEVGTSLRFIMRRLGTDTGPKELSKVGVSILGEEGGMRSGFDILDDLSKKWGDLSRAQKMAIAQGLGGTRQYNQVLVLMDNWSEALRNVKNSMDSKGSAERRNLILMKTYSKQLEQTKAMFSELKIEMGKLVLPSFKMGLSGIRGALSVINAIPSEFKLAAAGAAAFFAYVSKGQSVLSNLIQIVDKGKIAFSGLKKEFSKGIKVGGHELFGTGDEKDPDLFGLNSIQKGAGFDDLESSLGKLGYSLLAFGRYYNKFLGLTASDTGKPIKAVGSFVESVGNSISKLTTVGSFVPKIPVQLAAAAAETFVASPIKYVGKATKGAGSGIENLGMSLVENLGSDHASILKSMGPLLGTGLGLGIMAPKAISSIKDFVGSAKDLKDSKAGVIEANKKEIDSLDELINRYNALGTAQEELKKLQDPEELNRLKDIREYKSPMFFGADIEKQDKDFQKAVAKYAPSMIGSVTEYGGINLDRTNEEAVKYIKNLNNIRRYQEAMLESDIAVRFSEDLTKTDGNQNVKYIMNEVAKSVPLVGDMLEKGISVGPKKALSEFTKELNKVIVAKNANPLSTAFDPILDGMYKQLESIKNTFDDINSDFEKILESIDTRGLKSNQINSIFNREELIPGYDVMAATNDVYNREGVTGKQIMQRDIFRSVIANDEKVGQYIYGMLEPTGDITSERFKEANMSERSPFDNFSTIKTGDFVTVTDKFAEQYRIAGQQAMVEIDESNKIFLKYVDSITGEFVKALMYSGGQSNILDNSIKNIYPTDEIIRKAEEHRTKLATFITGAEAGIVGLDKENLNKRNLDLGTKFFSDIDTGTLLQTEKGYNISSGRFVNPDVDSAPTDWYKSGWAEDYAKYMKEPMKEYSVIMESVRGGAADSSNYLVGEDAERIAELQGIIQNNSVVFQFRQEMEALAKTIESSTRSVKNLIDAEKARNKVYVETYGFTKGAPKELAPPDLGVKSIDELSPHQMAMNSSSVYAEVAQRISSIEQERKGLISQIDTLVQTRSNINDMGIAQTAFGAVNIDNIKDEKDLEKYLKETQEQSGFTKSEVLIASHLDEINKATKDGTIEAQESNKWLSALVSIFTGASTKEKFEEKKSSLMEFKPEEFYTKKGLFSKSNPKLNKFNQEIIDLQNLSEEAGSKGGSAGIDLMNEIDATIRERTEMLLNSGIDFLEGRSEGSADTKKLLTAFSKGVSAAGVPIEGLINEFEITESGKSKKGQKVVSSLRKSVEESKTGYSEGMFSTGNMANTAAIALTFSKVKDLISGADVRNIDKAIEDLVNKKANLDEGMSSDSIDRDISALRSIREKRTNMKGVYDTVGGLAKTAIVAHGTGSIAGMDDSNIRNFMVASSGLYLAFKALKGNVDKLPKSFEEADKKIKDIDFEKVTQGIVDGKPINRASKKLAKTMSVFVKDLDKEMKAGGYSAGDDAGIKGETERIENKLRSVADEKDMEKLKGRFEKELSSGSEGSIRVLQGLMSALVLTTAQNYLDNKQEVDRQISGAEKTGSDQLEDLYYIFKKEPAIFKGFMEAAESGDGEEVQDFSKKLESMVISQGKERESYTDQINKTLETIGEKIGEFDGTLNELKSFANEVQTLSEVIKSLRMIELDHVKALNSIDINSMYGFPTSSGDLLRGFSGELRMPKNERDMSVQERMFSSSSEVFKDAFNTFYKFQRSYDTQFEALKVLSDKRISKEFDLAALQKQGNVSKDEENLRIYEISRLKKLENEAKNALDGTRESTIELGKSFKDLSSLSSYIYKLKDSLDDLNSTAISSSVLGSKNYNTNISKLLGGGHPLASVSVSPEQQRMASRVGVSLISGESTAKDVERAEILDKLETSKDPKEKMELSYRLSELDSKYENLVFTKEQTERNRLFETTQSPYVKLQEDLFRLLESGEITNQNDVIDIRQIISTIGRELESSVQVVSKQQKLDEIKSQYEKGDLDKTKYNIRKEYYEKSGLDYFYKGVDGGFLDKYDEIIVRFKEALQATSEEGVMYKAISQPIVTQLEKANGYLQTISLFYADKSNADNDPGSRTAPGPAPFREKDALGTTKYYDYVEDHAGPLSGIPLSREDQIRRDYLYPGFTSISDTKVGKFASNVVKDFVGYKLPAGTGFEHEPSTETISSVTKRAFSFVAGKISDFIDYFPEAYDRQKEHVSYMEENRDLYSTNHINIAKRRPIYGEGYNEYLKVDDKPLKVEDKPLEVEDKVLKARLETTEVITKDHVERKASGGRIFGAGGPREDKVPAYLSPGEFVIRSHTAQKLGYNTLDHINKKGTIPGFAEGGTVYKSIDEKNKYLSEKYPGVNFNFKDNDYFNLDQYNKLAPYIEKILDKYPEIQEGLTIGLFDGNLPEGYNLEDFKHSTKFGAHAASSRIKNSDGSINRESKVLLNSSSLFDKNSPLRTWDSYDYDPISTLMHEFGHRKDFIDQRYSPEKRISVLDRLWGIPEENLTPEARGKSNEERYAEIFALHEMFGDPDRIDAPGELKESITEFHGSKWSAIDPRSKIEGLPSFAAGGVVEDPYVITIDNIYDRFMKSKYVNDPEYAITRVREGLGALFERFANDEINKNNMRIDDVIKQAALGTQKSSNKNNIRSFIGRSDGINEVSGRYLDRNIGNNTPSIGNITEGGIRSFVGDASGVFEVSEKDFNDRSYSLMRTENEGRLESNSSGYDWAINSHKDVSNRIIEEEREKANNRLNRMLKKDLMFKTKMIERSNKQKQLEDLVRSGNVKDLTSSFNEITGFDTYKDIDTGASFGKARKGFYTPTGPFFMDAGINPTTDIKTKTNRLEAPSLYMPEKTDFGFSEYLPLVNDYPSDYVKFFNKAVHIRRYTDMLRGKISKTGKPFGELLKSGNKDALDLIDKRDALMSARQMIDMMSRGENIYTNPDLMKKVTVPSKISPLSKTTIGADGNVYNFEEGVPLKGKSNDVLNEIEYAKGFDGTVEYESKIQNFLDDAVIAENYLRSMLYGTKSNKRSPGVGVPISGAKSYAGPPQTVGLHNRDITNRLDGPQKIGLYNNVSERSSLEEQGIGTSGSEALKDGYLLRKNQPAASDSRSNMENYMSTLRNLTGSDLVYKSIIKDLESTEPDLKKYLANNYKDKDSIMGLFKDNISINNIAKDYNASPGMVRKAMHEILREFRSEFSEGGKVLSNILHNHPNNGSIPVFHNGGFVDKTGPIFAQKGEFILPKFFGDGGLVNSSKETISANLVSGSLNKSSIKLDGAEVLNELSRIKLRVDDKKLDVDGSRLINDLNNVELRVKDTKVGVEDKTVSIDSSSLLNELRNLTLKVEDKKLGVEDKTVSIDSSSLLNELRNLTLKVEDKKLGVETTNIKVDTQNVANQISSAITNAINSSKVAVDTTNIKVDSVGASARDAISEAIVSMDNKFLSSIAVVDRKINNLKEEIDNKIGSKVDEKLSISVSDINNRIGNVEYRLSDLYNNVTSSISRLAADANSIRSLAHQSLNSVNNL